MPRGRVMEMQAGWQSRPASGEMPPRGWGGFSLGGSCRGLLCCRWWDQRRSWSPARLQGHGLVVALVSQHSGRRCQALWQWPLCRSPGSCPVLVVSLVPPPSQMRYLHRAAWGQRKARVLVSCCPLAHPGDGAAGGCGSPPAWVLGWVLHADVPREISRHRWEMRRGLNIWPFSWTSYWKVPASLLCPFQSQMGVIDPAGRESAEQKLSGRGRPSALHRDVSQAVF